MSKNIVYEGWLTKSPPTKRIWRTKWRRRWFALRQSGELPGQYFLDYYADRNYRRLKGTINLDLCEQVDAGLHMERSGNGALDPKLRGSVFTIQTQSRTYHLEADCEADMEKWVDAICRVCGLRATDESPNVLGHYENNLSSISASNEQYECADGTGPYIPISECITGVRAQDGQRAFTFDPKNIMIMSGRSAFERAGKPSRNHSMYHSHPHIRGTNPDYSDNESNNSDEECKSLNTSQSNIREWPVAKSFTKLSISPKRNGYSENGPPVPPRPPKTFAMSKDIVLKEVNQSQDGEQGDNLSVRLRPPRLSQAATPPSPARPPPPARATDDEEEHSPGLASLQYCNLPWLPPAVDRALKPRHSSHSIGHINAILGQNALQLCQTDDMKPEDLQYLDLDLHTSKPPSAAKQAACRPAPEPARKRPEVSHGKSLSAVDADSAYKTVDFLKTEAFNITRQDAEASRSNQH